MDRRVLKFDGAFGPEGCGIAFGHTFGVRVLKMDRPAAGGFLGLTAFQAEGCGLPLCGNAYKISVTGFTFSVIGQNNHSAELSAFGRYIPYPAVPDFPRKRGQNKTPRSIPFISRSQHNETL